MSLVAALPILGVLLGAALTAAVAYGLRRRDERREVRAVARVLLPGLRSSAAAIDHAVQFDHWELLPTINVRSGVWDANSPRLAAHISNDDWSVLEKAFRGADDIAPMLATMTVGDDVWKREALAKVARDTWRDAIRVLERLADDRRDH